MVRGVLPEGGLVSLAQCPQCPERMVADRLADHLRYQHTQPLVCCDHCGLKLERDASRGFGKRFCDGYCQSLNYQAMLAAWRALEEYAAERGIPLTTPRSARASSSPPPSRRHPREG